MTDFSGRVALVTGGSSGIGRATTSRLQALGASVAVLDRDLDAVPKGVLGLHGDVTDEASISRAVATVVSQLGGLDVLVNNAGIGAQGTVESNEIAEWNHVLDVNLLGMVRVSRAALSHLRRSDAGVIVNTASVAADVGLPERVLYSATKGALVAASRAMAADLIGDGVRVCWVSPGTADTPWIGRLLDQADDPAAERTALEARQPHGRLVTADEVAEAICYLAGPASRSTTGVGLTVDGGLTALKLRR